MKRIGIYQIRNTSNDQRYIGQSVNIANRWVRHRYHLNKGVHKNLYLQRAWNKYGKDQFVFEILQECNPDSLDVIEEQYANLFQVKLYNMTDDFTSRIGDKNPFFGRKHSDKTKAQMSLVKKGKYKGSKNPNFGGKNRKVVSVLMTGSKNCNSKLDETKVVEIKKQLQSGAKQSEIAADFGVHPSAIAKINSGSRWSHVTI